MLSSKSYNIKSREEFTKFFFPEVSRWSITSINLCALDQNLFMSWSVRDEKALKLLIFWVILSRTSLRLCKSHHFDNWLEMKNMNI